MKIRTLLLAGAMLVPAAASAQVFNRIVTFGDSLSDNGNLFTAIGTPPAPYYQGRFSNGLVWAELLNGTMLRGPSLAPGALSPTANLNFAYGGARTDALTALPPGTGTQIGIFRLLGGTLGRGDVATLWAGANDILQAFPGAAASPGTAQATMGAVALAAGANVGQQVGALAAAGAGTVVTFSLPDLGAAPSFSSLGPLGAQLASFSASTFNGAWAASTAAAAAANPATNVIQIPVEQLFAAVTANAGAYGVSNYQSQCLTTAACVLGGATAQNGYLFWDGVHPTATGHALIANFTREYLFAPSRAAAAAALADVGFWSRRQGMADMMDRVQAANPGAKHEFFVSAIGEQGKRDTQAVLAGFSNTGSVLASSGLSARYAAGGMRFGGFGRINPEWTAGGALSVTVGEGKAGNVSFTPVAFAADVAARWSNGATFVNLGLGAQMTHYSEYERRSLVGALTNTGSPDGLSASAIAEAGYRIDMGAFAFVPKARLSYVVARVDGFAETGAVAPIRFGGRKVDGLAGGGELRMEAKVGGALAHVLVGYDAFLVSSSGRLTGKLINNSAQPFAVASKDPVGAGLLLGAGVDADFGGWKAGVAYRATIGQKSQTTHRGQITVSTAF